MEVWRWKANITIRKTYRRRERNFRRWSLIFHAYNTGGIGVTKTRDQRTHSKTVLEKLLPKTRHATAECIEHI